MNLQTFLTKINRKESHILEINNEIKAFEAVKQTGDALRYVKKSVFKD